MGCPVGSASREAQALEIVAYEHLRRERVHDLGEGLPVYGKGLRPNPERQGMACRSAFNLPEGCLGRHDQAVCRTRRHDVETEPDLQEIWIRPENVRRLIGHGEGLEIVIFESPT